MRTMFEMIRRLFRSQPTDEPGGQAEAPATIAAPPHPKELNLRTAKDAWRAGKTAVRHRPLMLQLEVTSHCNIDCIQCARVYDPRYDRKTGNMGMLSMETFHELEPVLPDIAESYLWGNGEAMLHPQFLEMVEVLKQHQIVITFNTHGMFLKNGKDRRLVDLGVEGITISIDGATRETYDKIRVGSSFDLVTGNIRNMTAYKRTAGSSNPILSCNYVAMSNNVHELGEMVRLAADIGLENVHFEPVAWNNDWTYYEKVFKPLNLSGNVDLDQVEACFREAVEEGQRLEVRVTSQLLDSNGRFDRKLLDLHEPKTEPTGERPEELDSRAHLSVGFNGRTSVCAEPWTTLFITWWGDVRTCCEGEKCFGNLTHDSIEQIWFGDEYQKFRQALRDGPPPEECVKCLMNRRHKVQFRELESCVTAIAATGR